MMTQTFNAYFRGPNPSGNSFGGASKNSPGQKAGRPYNTEFTLLCSQLSQDGSLRRYIVSGPSDVLNVEEQDESTFEARKIELAERTGSVSDGLTWEFETWTDSSWNPPKLPQIE